MQSSDRRAAAAIASVPPAAYACQDYLKNNRHMPKLKYWSNFLSVRLVWELLQVMWYSRQTYL